MRELLSAVVKCGKCGCATFEEVKAVTIKKFGDDYIKQKSVIEYACFNCRQKLNKEVQEFGSH